MKGRERKEKMSQFPRYRPRRLRRHPTVRRLVRETELSVNDLIHPLFVTHGEGVRREIPSMPGNFHLSVDALVTEAEEIAALGIPGVILFGLPARKDGVGSEAYAPDGIVQQGVRAIKRAVPDLLVITDVCLCEYTDHGHCGIVEARGGGEERDVANDPTLALLAKTALSHVEAGCDIVAPSDMMDGRVGAIRNALDEAGYPHVPILSYSVKYASAFYGPFREAADSAPHFGDRRSYQMDPPNGAEAVREARLDIEEGADILMVKPAGPYLDILHRLREAFPYPLAAYQVSGEYAMIKAAGAKGWIDEERVVLESLTAIKRAGADIILTYFAKSAARMFERG